MRITDEYVPESKELPKLVNNVIKTDSTAEVGKLFADGSYDGKNIFRFLTGN